MKPVQVTDELEDYMLGLLPKRDAVLTRLEEHAAREGVPIVGPHEGMLLHVLARAANAKRILELGAATGYSGLWLLRGGGAEASLTTIEMDPARAALARSSLAEAGAGLSAEVVEDDVFAALERLPGPFDLVFDDLLNSMPDERAIERLFRAGLERVRSGGLLLADNALRLGEVVRPSGQQARNVATYNRLVAAEPSLVAVIVPLRDGLSVAVKR
ncbi:MAG: O-methyltransferase [Chloroflexi bacterium]|nr:MAG: O-methyltransferase [Chloroflexota bacterium]TMD55190.1 MAG: O-methyltransferase [Chloroflexota bacterium]